MSGLPAGAMKMHGVGDLGNGSGRYTHSRCPRSGNVTSNARTPGSISRAGANSGSDPAGLTDVPEGPLQPAAAKQITNASAQLYEYFTITPNTPIPQYRTPNTELT